MMEKAMVMLLVLVVTPSSSVNAVTPTSTQSCSFKTDSDQCCAFPFEFEGKVYSQCTADGSEGEWKQQWRNPWCVTGEKRLQSACLRYAHSCGGERDSPGVISSSGFPSGYRNGSQCDWLINMPAANQITLNFTDVSLSKDQSCDDAYVDIFDGDNSTYPLLGRICGNSIPPPVVSSGNQMLIKFRAMRSGVGLGRGFRAYFDSGECAVRTYGGNGHGACCVFPFTYKGHLYNTCITKDTGTAGVIGNPWCSVTDNYDRDKKRGLCVTENVTCHPTRQFTCNNNHWWKQCIDISYKCDGKPECADHSDENNCPPLINPDRCNVIHIYQPRNKKHPFVWKLSRKCGYTNRCTLNTTQEERDAPCKISSWFKCRSGVCIPPQWICDGKDDCGDRSDESVGRCEYKDKKPSSCSWINDCKKTVNAWEKKFGEGIKSIQNTVVCYAKNTTTIPNYLPHTTTSMYLIKKRIKQLQPYSFERYGDLQKLDLRGNRITTIEPFTFANLNSLTELKLSNNLLKIIRSNTFDGLFSLEHLKLDGNPVTLIETAGFHGLRKIRELNLTNLDLETIHDNAFSGMDTLQRLYLDRNANLYRLPLDIFENLPLEFLKADRFEFCCIAKLSGANCSAPKDLFSSCNDLMANETLGISIWILGCIALFGNGFVLIWRLKTKSESRVHSLLLLNLALSDFMMGVYMVVIGSVDKYYLGKYFIYNEEWKRSHLCQFCGFLSTVSCEASVFILTTMTVDRYVAIVHPLRNLCLKISGAYKALISIWLLAFILAFLPLTGIKYFKDFYGRSGVCLPLHLTAEKPAGWEYSVFVFLVLNFISFMAIFILYFIMFIKIKQSHQLTGTGSHQRSATASIGSRMVFIVLTDFVCWIPIIIIGIASLSGMQAPPEVYAWVAVFVLPLNSALNPILYTISTTNFRKNVGAHYRRSSKRLQNLTYFTTDNPETEISRRVTKSMSLSTTKTTTPDTTLERRTLLRRNGKPASQKKRCKSCCSPIAERQEFIESPV